MTRSDPSGPTVPEDVVAAAKAVFQSRDKAPKLAPLVFDSLVDGTDEPSDHRLRFEHPDLKVDVTVRVTASEATVSGRVDPGSTPSPAVQLGGADHEPVAQVHDGRFEFSSTGHGLVRLVFGQADGEPIATDWFRL